LVLLGFVLAIAAPDAARAQAWPTHEIRAIIPLASLLS